jgi:hypothetical protein
VAQDGWSDDGYPETETIRLGRGSKTICVTLPFQIWWIRAVRWTQGLDLLNTLLAE